MMQDDWPAANHWSVSCSQEILFYILLLVVHTPNTKVWTVQTTYMYIVRIMYFRQNKNNKLYL